MSPLEPSSWLAPALLLAGLLAWLLLGGWLRSRTPQRPAGAPREIFDRLVAVVGTGIALVSAIVAVAGDDHLLGAGLTAVTLLLGVGACKALRAREGPAIWHIDRRDDGVTLTRRHDLDPGDHPPQSPWTRLDDPATTLDAGRIFDLLWRNRLVELKGREEVREDLPEWITRTPAE